MKKALFALALLVVAAGSAVAQQGHIGLNQRVLVIPVKYSDIPVTRLTGEEWITLLNTQVNPLFLQTTQGKTSFLFERPTSGVPADGWLTLAIAHDNLPATSTDLARMAVAVADPYVNMANYDRVLVLTNRLDDRGESAFGAQTAGYQWIPVDEGGQTIAVFDGIVFNVRSMCITTSDEWIQGPAGTTYDWGASEVAHELGHQLELPTHYQDIRWSPTTSHDSITPWDLMGLSPGMNHFLGWAKHMRGFMDTGRVTIVGPPYFTDLDMTFDLAPQEQALTSGLQLIRVPFSASIPFIGYVVENRRRIDGDAGIPSEGILVTLVDESPGRISGTKAIVMSNPVHPDDIGLAALAPQETFTDTSRNISITHVRRDDGTSQVRVQYGFPPPGRADPAITPWGGPPWTTPDIWIDSQLNGWDVYRYSDGNRDDAWVDHDNRVHFRIRNPGTAPASNIHVTIFVNSPPGLGDAGPDWGTLASINVPSIEASGSYESFVTWRPTVGEHTCLRVLIEPYSGELNTTNNQAQANVMTFDSTAHSPYEPVTLTQTVFNPFPAKDTPVHVLIRDIPEQWKWKLVPEDLVVPAGGTGQVTVTLYPPDPTLIAGNRQGMLLKPKIEAQVDFADSFVAIGGTEMRVHLTYACKLSCDVSAPGAGVVLAKGKLTQLQPNIVGMKSRLIGVDLIAMNDQGTQRTLIVRTNIHGRYTVQFTDVKSGRYLVRAAYAGSSKVQRMESNPIELVVP